MNETPFARRCNRGVQSRSCYKYGVSITMHRVHAFDIDCRFLRYGTIEVHANDVMGVFSNDSSLSHLGASECLRLMRSSESPTMEHHFAIPTTVFDFHLLTRIPRTHFSFCRLVEVLQV